MVLIITGLSSALIVIIDGLLTSRYLGAEMMSAQGIASVYFPIVSIITCILSLGCQTLTVEYVSKCKKDDARKVITMSSIIGVGLTLFVTLIIWLFSDSVAVLFGAPEGTSIQSSVVDYLRGASVGACGWLLFVVLSPIIQLDGGGKICTLASIVMAIVDVGCDILLGIVLKMGLFGMGLASGLSHISAGVIMLTYMFSKKCGIKYDFKNISFKSFNRVFINGIPRALSMISKSIGPIILNFIVLNIVVNDATTTVGMSAYAVQKSVSYVVTSIGYAIGGSIFMIGTFYYNERNYSGFKSTLLIALRSIFHFVFPFALILFIASPLITKLYISGWETDSLLYETTLTALKFYFISLPFLAFNVSFSNYMQSIGKKSITNVLNIIIECICPVIACFVLSRSCGYRGFFVGFFVGQAALSLICVITFLINCLSSSNKYKKLFLPRDFVKDSVITIEKTLTTIEEASDISESVRLLKNVCSDNRKIFKVALCVEEVCTNIIKHGFAKDNKKHSIMVRVVVEDERVVLTIKDDCKMFDITKKLKVWELDSEHPEKNIGIRMIMSLSKEIYYSNIMNMNNLQIII